jgi:hypothetical protein
MNIKSAKRISLALHIVNLFGMAMYLSTWFLEGGDLFGLSIASMGALVFFFFYMAFSHIEDIKKNQR